MMPVVMLVNNASLSTLPTGHDNLIDINSAPLSWLESLPGIDDSLAEKIVSNRPYETRDDLFGKAVLPESTYEQIKDLIIAR